jgi:hypothetical protein
MSMLLRLLGFALLLAIAVAALAPAALLAPAVARLTSGVLVLVEAEGSAWNGRGTLATGSERMPVAWRVEPAGLLGGELVTRLIAADPARPSPRARLSASRDRFAVADLDVALPAAALLHASDQRATLALDGTLHLRAAALERRAAGITGRADLAWERAGIRLGAGSPSFDLGSVAIALTGSGDRLHGPVTNRGGSFAVTGGAGIDARGAATIDVLVTPRVPPDPATFAMLGGLGRREGEGWRLQWPAPTR